MAIIDQLTVEVRSHDRYTRPEKILSNPPSEETVEQWTDALSDFAAESTVSADVEADLRDIRRFYSENEQMLGQYAATLDVQPIGQSSPKEVLFTVYLRTLQSRYAGETNLDCRKFRDLLEGNYSIEGRGSENGTSGSTPTEGLDSGAANVFEPGETYHRLDDIHRRFGANRFRRISPSADHPYIFVFFGESDEGHGYDDELQEDGTLLYTGEGRNGDMEMAGGNAAIRNHETTGDELHVFEMEDDAWQVTYVGQYRYEDHRWVRLPDGNDEMREAIRFELVSVD